MPALALFQFVNFPLTLNHRGRAVVERIKSLSFSEAISAACSVISAIGVTGGIVLYFSGAFAGATISAARLTGIEKQVGGLSTQMQRMQDQMNAGVRADQLIAIERHLSAQDGRMDGMDTRTRDQEARQSRTEARQEMMEAASRAQLRPR